MSYLEDLERLQAQLTGFVSENPEYDKDRRHILFVYGTMKRGLRNHARLAKARFLGEAITRGDCYLMWTKQVPGTTKLAPVLTPDGTFRIRGELYEVDGDILSNIDLCEGHPVVYERFQVDVDLVAPFQGVNRNLYGAWTYLWGAHSEQKLTRKGVQLTGDVMEFAP